LVAEATIRALRDHWTTGRSIEERMASATEELEQRAEAARTAVAVVERTAIHRTGRQLELGGAEVA
jgi:hypothetical protein